MYYPIFTKVIIDYFMTRKPSIPRRNRINWHYVRDDVLFSTIKVVSRHQTTQQYGAILPIELTTDEIRNNVERTEAEQLKIVLKRRRQETHISQQRGSSTDEGTGSRPGVLDVPSDDSEEELLWNSSDDEDVDEQTKGGEESKGDKTDGSDNRNDDDNDETVKAGSESDKDDDDNDDEEELAKNDDEDIESDKAILDTYGESTISKRRREDDDQEGPFAGSDRGSKRQREGGEHASDSTPSETATGSADFSNFIINRLGVATLTPELLAGPTYELIRGSCTSLTELEFHLEEVYKATIDQLDWVNPE
nr:hypothetical protein [Tanacetum cinerariifolium]